MQIRYNRLIAGIMIGLGVVNIGLGLWLLALGEFATSLIIGLLVAAIGAAYLNRPYFHLEKGKIVIPALIGPVKRTFEFNTSENLEITENKIQVNNGKSWKRVPVYRWMSHPEDWQAFIKELQSYR
jgi:hypothetical protein